jgi:hypothetical protein
MPDYETIGINADFRSENCLFFSRETLAKSLHGACARSIKFSTEL